MSDFNNNPDIDIVDPVLARRRAIAEAIRKGEVIFISPSGEPEFQSEAQEQGHTAIQVPDGKLAYEG